MSVAEAFNYWIERHCIANGLVKVDYYRRCLRNISPNRWRNVKVDNTAKMHWINVFDSIESRVMAHCMLSLCKRAFRFCVNRKCDRLKPTRGITYCHLMSGKSQKENSQDGRWWSAQNHQWLKAICMSIESVFCSEILLYAYRMPYGWIRLGREIMVSIGW